jgi:hypothetical protein
MVMIKIKRDLRINIMTFILAVALLISMASGFAVSSSYYAGLQLYPGEERDIYLTLQNMAGNDNLSARATIDEGQEIARLADPSNTYFIPLGTHKKVNIKVKIPEDAQIGSTYNLTLSFGTIKESKPGEFGISSGVGERIVITVIEKPKLEEPVVSQPEVSESEMPEEKSDLGTVIVIAAIILIIGLLITQTMVNVKKLKPGKKKVKR